MLLTPIQKSGPRLCVRPHLIEKESPQEHAAEGARGVWRATADNLMRDAATGVTASRRIDARGGARVEGRYAKLP